MTSEIERVKSWSGNPFECVYWVLLDLQTRNKVCEATMSKTSTTKQFYDYFFDYAALRLCEEKIEDIAYKEKRLILTATLFI